MPWRGPAYAGEFPTLGYEVAEWIQALCVVPDRDFRGTPFLAHRRAAALPRLPLRAHARGPLALRPRLAARALAEVGQGAAGRRVVCAEAEGPVCFDGWDAAGEPVGKPWATPHIQITACSEEQTDNTWRAIQPMIELGPLGETFIPDTGLTRINLRGGGLIEPVTASARSRLGQRISFAVQDQTESWIRSNNGYWLADNQRRNLAGMGGRFLETCNAPDPAEQSVASRTPTEPGVYIDDVDGGPGSVRNKVERRKVLRKVYGDSPPSAAAGSTSTASTPRSRRCSSTTRRRPSASSSTASSPSRAPPSTSRPSRRSPARTPFPRRKRSSSASTAPATATRSPSIATHVKTGYQWPVIILERPPHAPEDYEHDFKAVDGAVSDAMERYLVWRAYCDDQYIGTLIEGWQNRFGERRVVIWHTNRPRPIAWAVRNYEDAVASGDLSHDGDDTFVAHIRNSRRRKLTVLDDTERQMHTLCKDTIGSPRKIDAAMAASCRGRRARTASPRAPIYLGAEPEAEAVVEHDRYSPNHAPGQAHLAGFGAAVGGPMPV
jgi:hypothetical protein